MNVILSGNELDTKESIPYESHEGDRDLEKKSLFKDAQSDKCFNRQIFEL